MLTTATTQPRETRSVWPSSSSVAKKTKVLANVGESIGAPIAFAAVKTSITRAAASHTHAAQSASRAARHCENDARPGAIRCPGRRKVAARSAPMVRDAAAS
jgi:hypothetical protein